MEIEPPLEYGFIRPEGFDLSGRVSSFPSYGDTSDVHPYANFDDSSVFADLDASNYFSGPQVFPKIPGVKNDPLYPLNMRMYGDEDSISTPDDSNTDDSNKPDDRDNRYMVTPEILFYAMVAAKLESDRDIIKKHILSPSADEKKKRRYKSENPDSTGYMVLYSGADSSKPFESLFKTGLVDFDDLESSPDGFKISCSDDIVKYLLNMETDETLILDAKNNRMGTVYSVNLPDLTKRKWIRDKLSDDNYYKKNFGGKGIRGRTARHAMMVADYQYTREFDPKYEDFYVGMAKQSPFYNFLTGNVIVYGPDGPIREARILDPGAPGVEEELNVPMLEILIYNNKGVAKKSRFKLADIMEKRDAYAIYREIYEGECPDIIGTKSVDPIPVGIV